MNCGYWDIFVLTYHCLHFSGDHAQARVKGNVTGLTGLHRTGESTCYVFFNCILPTNILTFAPTFICLTVWSCIILWTYIFACCRLLDLLRYCLLMWVELIYFVIWTWCPMDKIFNVLGRFLFNNHVKDVLSNMVVHNVEWMIEILLVICSV